jgi:hypothetical protein
LDVIINEVTSTVRMIDKQSLLDPQTLSTIIRSVMSAIDDHDTRQRRRDEETRIPDDGRGGISGTDRI